MAPIEALMRSVAPVGTCVDRDRTVPGLEARAEVMVDVEVRAADPAPYFVALTCAGMKTGSPVRLSTTDAQA